VCLCVCVCIIPQNPLVLSPIQFAGCLPPSIHMCPLRYVIILLSALVALYSLWWANSSEEEEQAPGVDEPGQPVKSRWAKAWEVASGRWLYNHFYPVAKSQDKAQ
jgi:hypothetical protein